MGCAARGGANPGGPGGAPSAAPRAWPFPRPRPRSARGPRPAPPGTRVRSDRGGRLAPPPVQVHPRGWSPRRWERVPLAAPSPESSVARRSREPSPRPSWLRWAAGLRQGPGPGPPAAGSQVQRGGSAWKRSPTSSPPLLRGESGLSRKLFERPACAFTVSPRSAEEKQLPPKSCLPLPPKAPRRFVRRVRDLQSICLRGRKMSVTVPNERRVFF